MINTSYGTEGIQNTYLPCFNPKFSSWPSNRTLHPFQWIKVFTEKKLKSHLKFNVIRDDRRMSLLFFSCSAVSDSSPPRGLQPARLPCPSPSPRVCSYSHPGSRRCHRSIPPTVAPSPPALSFPASGSFASAQTLSLWHMGSVVAVRGPPCATAWISVLWLGVKPMSPALQWWFVTSGPQGKFMS